MRGRWLSVTGKSICVPGGQGSPHGPDGGFRMTPGRMMNRSARSQAASGALYFKGCSKVAVFDVLAVLAVLAVLGLPGLDKVPTFDLEIIQPAQAVSC